MYKKLTLILFVCFFLAGFTFGQKNIVHVNYPTGTANILIPIYVLKSGSVSIPVDLIYSASGIKPSDVEGSAGLGWNLSAGGAVTRQLRGLPDDIKADLLGNARLGWLYTDATKPVTLPITNNNSSQSTVTADINSINSDFGDLSDSEPDIFNVDAPGLSCKLVFDNNKIIRTIPYQDLKINIGYNTDGTIASFKITNDQGITYTFAAAEPAVRTAYNGSSNTPYFRHDWQQFQNGIGYTSAWDLTGINDIFNNAVYISYTAGIKKGSDSPVQLYLNGSNTPTTMYRVWQNNIPNLISRIYTDNTSFAGQSLRFTYTSDPATYTSFISTITVPNMDAGLNNNFQFQYLQKTPPSKGTSLGKFFLVNVQDIQNCSSPLNYSFKYSGDSNPPNSHNTLLPDSSAMGIDYWGFANGFDTYNTSLQPNVYINPSNSAYSRFYAAGNNLVPSSSVYSYSIQGYTARWATTNSIYGTLDTISYADGGATYLTYQNNYYYDNTIQSVVGGNGIRISSIADYDGLNAANNITKTYSYNDPQTGVNSGKAISLPLFAFTIPYSGTATGQSLWNSSVAVSASDLSSEDHSVVYGSVTETQTGAGSTLYQFSTPVTNWDNSAPSGLPAWSPTMIYAGSATSSTIGLLRNDINSWPFPPNLNYDFERALPTKVVKNNGSGQAVSETDFTYSTPQASSQITAFKYEINSFGESYAKYGIYYNMLPVTTIVTNKLYDLAPNGTPLTTNRTTTTSNTYNNTQFKLVQQSTLNSDGSSETTNTKYLKDYNINTTGDAATQAMQQMQYYNINTPVEKYFSVTPSGGSPVVTGGQVMIYGVVPSPNGSAAFMPFLPVQVLKFTSAAGLSSYVPSSISNSNTFQHDPNYNIVAANYLAYDDAGNILNSGDAFKNIQTTITDHNTNKPVATFKNANYNEIIYNDFFSNDEAGLGFPISNAGGATPRVFGTGVGFSGSASKTITKNAQATSYIFSVWVKSNTAGILTVSFQGGTVSKSGAINYGATAGMPTGWQYCEVAVPVSAITTATMNVTLSATSGAPIIGDVLCYPDVAEVTTYAYNWDNQYPSAITNTNGVSNYFKYDNSGRLLYHFDQDMNILQRNSYVNAANYFNFVIPQIVGPSTANNNISVTYTAKNSYNACIVSGMTYQWDFGDNTGIVTTPSTTQSHTYTANGTYYIKLTAVSPVYGSETTPFTYKVIVTNLPQSYITYTNTTNYNINTPKTNCAISTISFKQGTTTLTYNQLDFQSKVSIPPGVYTVTVQATGPQFNPNGTDLNGYYSINVTAGGNYVTCFPYSSTGAYTFQLDCTYLPSVDFHIGTAACSGGIQ